MYAEACSKIGSAVSYRIRWRIRRRGEKSSFLAAAVHFRLWHSLHKDTLISLLAYGGYGWQIKPPSIELAFRDDTDGDGKHNYSG